ncbi:MAG: hypothetical protein WBV59_18490, partial [Anaerolineae bacterium]
ALLACTTQNVPFLQQALNARAQEERELARFVRFVQRGGIFNGKLLKTLNECRESLLLDIGNQAIGHAHHGVDLAELSASHHGVQLFGARLSRWLQSGQFA